MFFMEYKISLLLSQSKMFSIYTTHVFPYIYRQTATCIHKHEHANHLYSIQKLEQTNKSLSETVEELPGHSNTVAKSINVLYPTELFLGVLL